MCAQAVGLHVPEPEQGPGRDLRLGVNRADPVRAARIWLATAANWSIILAWQARSEGGADQVTETHDRLGGWPGSSRPVSQSVMLLSSRSRTCSTASTGGMAGSASPSRSDATVAG